MLYYAIFVKYIVHNNQLKATPYHEEEEENKEDEEDEEEVEEQTKEKAEGEVKDKNHEAYEKVQYAEELRRCHQG